MKFYKKKIITRGDNVPYLVRYSIFSCRWFAIKVHNILISDDDCLHDHPWAFISVILKGNYLEHRIIKKPSAWIDGSFVDFKIAKLYKAGNIIYRPCNSIHRLVVDKPVWTFVITFKKLREWGFYTPTGWIPWFNYRSSGERCGE